MGSDDKMDLTDHQYNLLNNLEEEGIYGQDTISSIIDAFDITEQNAQQILLQYMKLPKLNRAGQVSMARYKDATSFDIVIGIIALFGIVWGLSAAGII